VNVESRTLKELFDLTGKVALVIGGTGYLGQALSQALAEAGARVAIGSRSQERADATVQGLPGGTSLHLGLVCDVGDEASTRHVVDQAAEHFGRLDILVNSTVGPRRVDINDAGKADFDYSLAVNLVGPFIASQQAAIHMRGRGGGSIIHIGSIYGLVGSYPRTFEGLARKMSPTYHASKGGLIQLTRYQAVYWARDNIRVNCLSPGSFPPPTREATFRERLAQEVPLGRNGLPWELKGAIVFLASQASSYVTGQNLLVDGGWTAW
jgi:NAD(P)-dependent dehydrogenase (short-subunit alcohol dehydrogenase family)